MVIWERKRGDRGECGLRRSGYKRDPGRLDDGEGGE